MKTEKILYVLLLIFPLFKIVDVILALVYSMGSVSLEWDGAYYIILGFLRERLFKEDKLALLSLFVMLLMTTFSILIKYNVI